MKRHLTGFVALLGASLCLCGGTGDGGACEFGKDRLVFAQGGSIEDDDLARPYDGSLRSSFRSMVDHHYLLKEGVSVCYIGKSRFAVSAGKIAPITWRNVGRYIKPVRTEKEIVALVSLFHWGYQDKRARLGPDGLSAVVAAARLPEWPFAVSEKHLGVDADTLSRGVFVHDDKWFVHFLAIEGGTSVVEYKYVIAQGNRIARLRRVIIRGPKYPGRLGEPRPLPSRLSVEKRDQWREFERCLEFLCQHALVRPPRQFQRRSLEEALEEAELDREE